jgi:hypothetical protein
MNDRKSLGGALKKQPVVTEFIEVWLFLANSLSRIYFGKPACRVGNLYQTL